MDRGLQKEEVVGKEEILESKKELNSNIDDKTQETLEEEAKETQEEPKAEVESKEQEEPKEEDSKVEAQEDSKEETKAEAQEEAQEEDKTEAKETQEETKAEVEAKEEDSKVEVQEDSKEETKAEAQEEAKEEKAQEEEQKEPKAEVESKEQEEAKAEDSKEEAKEESKEDILEEESPELTQVKKEAISTGDKAKLVKYKVLKAKESIKKAEAKLKECLNDIEGKINHFKTYEKEHLSPLIANSRQLIERAGAKSVEVNEEPSIDVELKSSKEKLEVEEPPSGAGLALISSIIGGLLVVAGWCALISKKLGMPVPPKEVPDMATINKLLASISDMFGQGAHASVGIAIVAGSALVVMWLIYTVIMSVKVSNNIQKVEEMEKKAIEFSKEKLSCKDKLKGVREHLDSVEDVVKSYEVILTELNATLTRALHIEKVKGFDELHDKTKEVVSELQHLLKEIDELLSTPISKEGAVTKESKEALAKAKKAIDDYIAKIYQ